MKKISRGESAEILKLKGEQVVILCLNLKQGIYVNRSCLGEMQALKGLMTVQDKQGGECACNSAYGMVVLVRKKTCIEVGKK